MHSGYCFDWIEGRGEVARLGSLAMADMLRGRERFDLGCDALQIGFHASVDVDIGDSEAHFLRVCQRADGILEDLTEYISPSISQPQQE